MSSASLASIILGGPDEHGEGHSEEHDFRLSVVNGWSVLVAGDAPAATVISAILACNTNSQRVMCGVRAAELAQT